MRRILTAVVLVPIIGVAFTLVNTSGAQQLGMDVEYATDLEAQLEARLLGNLSTVPGDEWFLLSTKTSPAGGLAGFHWAIPEDARHVYPNGAYSLFIEFAPWTDAAVLDGDHEWGVFVFEATPDGTRFVGALLEITGNTHAWTGPLVTRTLERPSAVPVQIGLTAPDEVNDLFFVLAARGPVGEEFGLGVRVWKAEVFSQAPQPDRAAFMAAQVRPDPYVPLRTGGGQGVTWDGYGAGASLFAFARETRYGSMQVTDSIPVNPYPAVTARDLHLASEGPSDMGWSDMQAFLFQHPGESVWSVEGTLFDTPLEAEGVYVSGGPVLFLDLVSVLATGAPFFHVTAEGEGGSRIEYNLKTANANHLDLFSLVHVGFGQTLEALLGSPSTRQVEIFDGVLGPEGPLARLSFPEDRTVLSAGGSGPQIAFPGGGETPEG